MLDSIYAFCDAARPAAEAALECAGFATDPSKLWTEWYDGTWLLVTNRILVRRKMA